MELLDYLRRSRQPLAEIRDGTREIYDAVLNHSPWITEAGFVSIHSSDLEFLFERYDERFFNGLLGPAARVDAAPLTFRISKRMTRVGGTTTRYRHHEPGGPLWSHEIAVSSTLLFSTFHDVNRPILVTGIECHDRLQALQRIFEHELIHLTELVIWNDSSCAQQQFQSLAFQLFAHTEATHDLITPDERAVKRFGIKPGDRVRFQVDGSQHEGFVNRITKRATVLVEDENSPLYSDGRRYAKFYVPIGMLEPVEAR